ncbi:bifunctional folylpolyglutamate synthase/dihydrofolate synthase [Wenyingzhuangia marina]|uniref:Dihydrofolate synthase/folylpolyglutamate synthase n=1 Tax=Wenyingzhuangia marina TaxID=1195760 RepID=A0A1M5X2D2_9FLAO|nr:folylpolyglutamate synthase/dihydrofolate synthase family protein [Wenyingzhuangia marina]GGF61052.1 tetrahydrofolate synthase [Wenyingzhuangia marina]SHH93752.1 dihydrofolate synthase / folylpolyglutamate synthase [Wenyingzhuangia marina]
MNYQETLDWLFSQLPMYQKDGAKAYKKDLSNTLLLMDYLGNPEQHIKAIHVAGTNGKGSTSHMLASVLQEQGYQVGLYTSPHLIDFRERIKINGKEIAEEYIVDFVAKHKSFFEQNALSFFEMTVGLSFEYFKDAHVDYVVLETGMGGRLDSTNVVIPLVSVITNIGLDHTQFLGTTLPVIAKEKGGIIKQNRPVVIGEYHEETFAVFQETANQKNAPLFKAFDLEAVVYDCELKGIYQKHNLKTVIQTIEVLKTLGIKITDGSIENGLSKVIQNTGLLGRYQIVQEAPKLICDTGHNKEGISLVVSQLLAEDFEILHIVFGVVDDKDLSSVLPLLPKQAAYYFTRPSIARGLSQEKLKASAQEHQLIGESYATVEKAVNEVLSNANPKDLIYVGGSTFVVADYLSLPTTNNDSNLSHRNNII